MSICAISVEPQRIMIATDTHCQAHGEPHTFETSKIFPVAHAGAALAAIGSTAIAQEALVATLRPGVEVDFDFLEVRMQGVLEEIFRSQLSDARRSNQEARAAALSEGNLIFLAGWSRASSRMRAQVFMQWSGSAAFRPFEIPRFSVNPRDPSAAIVAPADDEELVRLAAGAIRYGRRINPGGPFGGKLVVAEVRRDSMSLSIRSAGLPAEENDL